MQEKPPAHTARKQLSHEQVARLVVKSAKGSKDAFSRLYEAYLPQIYYYARKRLSSDDEAVEIVQDTFLAAFMKLDTLKNPRAFHSWIFSIASAYIAGRQRRRSSTKEHEQSLDALTECVQAAAETTPLVEFLTTEDSHPTETDHPELISAIDALTDAQKEVILLHYFAGLSTPEISAAVGLSQSATLKRLHDARNSLRKRLTIEETELSKALHEEETNSKLNSATGPGAQVTLGIAGALPMLMKGAGDNAQLASRAQAFLETAAKASLAPALANHVAFGTAVKVAAVTMTLVLATASGAAILNANKNKTRPTPAAHTSQQTAAETSAPTPTTSTTTEEKPAAVVEPEKAPAATEVGNEAAASTQPQIATTPPEPPRPVITVSRSQLTYARNTTPQTSDQIIAACGAAATSAEGATLPVTLSGLSNIDWTRAGSYVCYLHATDSAGMGAKTHVVFITING